MNNLLELAYLDIIADLKQLKHLVPSSELQNRIRQLATLLPAHHHVHPWLLPTMRLVLTLLILFVFTGSSLILASQKSQPGHLLYPVKILSHQLSGTKETVSVSPGPINSSVKLAQEPPAGSSPALSLTPKDIGGAEVILPPLLPASPTPVLSSPVATVSPPQVEADVDVNLNPTVPVAPSPPTAPTVSPIPVIDLPLLDLDQTESRLELKVGKEGKPLFKIGL